MFASVLSTNKFVLSDEEKASSDALRLNPFAFENAHSSHFICLYLGVSGGLIMKEQQVEQRLQQLKLEFESGQKMLADLDAKKADLQQTLLRISGAIQVLEEMLIGENEAEEGGKA